MIYYTINRYTSKVSTNYSVMTGLPKITHEIETSIIHSHQVNLSRLSEISHKQYTSMKSYI